MPDNTFVVGATIEVGPVTEGMKYLDQVTAETLGNVKANWMSASVATAKAMSKISADTIAGALTVTEGSARVAEASLAHATAQKEVAAATLIARKAGEDNAAELAVLASAHQKAAAAALELKAAQEVLGVSTVKVGGAMGMARVEAGALDGSTSMVVGGFARLAAQSETLAPLIQAAFVPFAITAFADILFQAGEKAYHAYQNVFLLKSSIDALDKASEQEASKAADLNYQYEEAYAKRLEATGHLKDAALELQKAEADKPLALPKIDDKEFKQFSSEFVTFLQAVHTSSDAPTVVSRIRAEASATQEQLTAAKARLDELKSAQEANQGAAFDAPGRVHPAGDTTIEVDTSHAQANVDDLTKKLGLLQTMIGSVQSETGIAYEAATTKMAEGSKKAAEAIARENEAIGKATREHDALSDSATKVVASYNKLFETEIEMQNSETHVFGESQQKDLTLSIESLGKLTEARKKDAEEQARQAEANALHGVDIGETGAKGTATLQEAKLPSENLSETAKAKATEAIQQQELAKLRTFEDQKLQIELDYYSKQLSTLEAPDQGPQTASQYEAQKAAVARVYGEIEALKQQHAAKMRQFDQQEALAVQDAANKQLQAYMRAFQGINQGFETATQQILQGTMTVQQAFIRMGENIVMSTIKSTEQIVLTHIEAAAEIKVVGALSALTAIIQHAAVAAAAAFAAWIGVPFAGPALAAGGAADATSTVMGFAAGIASAEGGMVSDQEQLAFIHRKEMVLPAALSTGFQHIIGNMNTQSSASSASGDSGGGSSETNHNYGGVHISAFDSKGVADMIHRNRGEFTRAAANIVRNNGWRRR